MHTWNIYLERADSDDERQFLGVIQAATMAEALQLASEYYEIREYDLIAERAS